MANSTPNIEVEEPNFCIGPQAGTYCSVDSFELIPVMRVKNFEGDLIRSYEFSPNNIISAPLIGTYPYNTVLGLKYIGPTDLASFYTGAIFFTFEKTFSAGYQYLDVNTGLYTTSPYSDSFIIRRWEVDQSTFKLIYKEAWYRNSNPTDFFNCYDFVLQYYITTLSSSTPAGTGYIELTTTSGIQKYDTLLLGPSSDADNTGAVEYVYVHAIGGSIAHIRTYDGTFPTKYEYVVGDPVTRIGNFFVFSDPRPVFNELGKIDSYEHDYGYLYELDYSDYATVLNKYTSGAYKGVYGATWNSTYGMPTFTRWNNVLSVNINTNEIFKAQTLYNIEDGTTPFPAYGIEIVGTDVLLLQNKAYLALDQGFGSHVTLTYYNIILDSLLPYTFSVDVTSEYQTLFRNDLTTIHIVVRDQFGVGLLGKNVYVYDSGGDPDSVLDPVGGYVVTDANGYCSVLYRSGFLYTGESTISVRSDGGNTVHGSSYVWGTVVINTSHEFEVAQKAVTQHTFEDVDYKGWVLILGEVEGEYHTYEIPPFCFPAQGICKHPIFDDGIASMDQNVCVILTLSFPTQGKGLRGFRDIDGSYVAGLPPLCSYNEMHIEQYDYDYEGYLTSYTEPDSTWMLSQLTGSRHLIGLNIVSTTVDQYVFVQDARPAMFSYKNTVDTDYWIRLRPFAFSLNISTLVVRLREINVGFDFDSGWYDIVALGTPSYFDAGGGVQGVDFIHQPTTPFKNKSVVHVFVQVHDYAPIPNLLTVEYWFEVIDDYRKPYIFDRVPDSDEENVLITSAVTFKISDLGAGVNINTLELFVNNSIVSYSYTQIDERSYYIEYLPLFDFKFGDTIFVYVRATDLAINENIMVDGWRFYTAKSTGPWFDFSSFRPIPCRRGVVRTNTLVRFRVYGIDDNGLDISSLSFQVSGRDQIPTITPIIYRLN